MIDLNALTPGAIFRTDDGMKMFGTGGTLEAKIEGKQVVFDGKTWTHPTGGDMLEALNKLAEAFPGRTIDETARNVFKYLAPSYGCRIVAFTREVLSTEGLIIDGKLR